jgi:hypothetical protein
VRVICKDEEGDILGESKIYIAISIVMAVSSLMLPDGWIQPMYNRGVNHI